MLFLRQGAEGDGGYEATVAALVALTRRPR